MAGEAAKPCGASARFEQVRYAFRTGEGAWRVGLPAPAAEPKFAVIEFER